MTSLSRLVMGVSAVKWQNLQVWCHSQAVTSFLVLLCISTLRDEDHGPVGNDDRDLEQRLAGSRMV